MTVHILRPTALEPFFHFKGLTTPSVKVDGGFIPDLHSRYFTADFSYGLSIIKQIAYIADVQTPNIDRVMSWYRKIAIKKEEFRFENYGIVNKEKLASYYLK